MRLLLLLALLAGPPAELRVPLEPFPNVSVGRVSGTSAFVAVSREGGKLRVYVCDGTLRRDATVSVWFRGRAGARTLHAGGHTLTLDGDRGRFDGRPFTLRRAKAPSGLFQGTAKGTTATWIVLGDRRKRGAFVPTRPPKCRFVLVTNSSGQQQWVSVCGA
jgi:hypothetical protein